MSMSLIDQLIERIIEMKAPIVVGLDPSICNIPDVYKSKHLNLQDGMKAVGNAIYDFNKDVIDVVASYVPAVKPQIAYYEAYGIYGIMAFYKTVQYAKKKGLIVIEDGKRNDIGSTAQAYADGHLGRSDNLKGFKESAFDVDFLTVNPYLGSDGLNPFVDVCRNNNKGIFVLVKTSNESSGEFQDKILKNNKTVFELVADYVCMKSKEDIGKYGYSSVGAVVGATYPEQAATLRDKMKNSFFLVPGYGQQGGTADDVISCFHDNGLGAIINSSRGILYSYKNKYSVPDITKKEFKNEIEIAIKEMQEDILYTLRKKYTNMIY